MAGRLPEFERKAVALELHAIADELKTAGKPSSQADVGALLGGLTQAGVSKAMKGELGHDVRDRVLRFRKTTIEALVAKHSTGQQPQTFVVRDSAAMRYGARERAIEAHVLLDRPRELVERAADRVGVSLKEDPAGPPTTQEWFRSIGVALAAGEGADGDAVDAAETATASSATRKRFQKAVRGRRRK